MARNKGGNQRDRVIKIVSGGATLEGALSIPPNAKGIVLFAHGAGSSRFSPRNQFVAQVLQEGGMATLLFDLLTPEEAEDRRNVFDIELLADRLQDATDWVRQQPETNSLPIGYFGASTGAAAALVAAAKEGATIRAIVSRGGRTDLAGDFIQRVTAPTLLIVGEYDVPVIALNQQSYDLLRGTKQLRIVPRATHLFEEPGALEEAALAAREWLERYLPMAARLAA